MFKIRIADIAVGIINRHEFVRRLCCDYIYEGLETDFWVSADEAEIKEEILASGFSQTPAYAESICIYRKICLRMPDYNAYLFHSAVVEYNGAAYAFAAASGTGKSTHAKMWTEYFGESARIINGDKPILRFFENCGFFIYGTPWCGKEGKI